MVTAAMPGLQDGSPRSALLSLAARVDGVGPDDWHAEGLTQVFGPRGAIYVVPKTDMGVFTRGLLPRDPAQLTALADSAARVDELLEGEPMRQADVVATLPDIGGTRGLRWAATLGTLLPVWDTVDTIVHPVRRPSVDAEAARLELARRFFEFLGPATVKDLQWWLDGLRSDAAATIAGLGDELEPVTVDGLQHLALAASLDRLTGDAPEPHNVHLLPPDDAYINRLHRGLLVPDPLLQRRLWPAAPPPGALVVGGEIVGTWRRRAGSVDVEAWREPVPALRERVGEIVAALPHQPHEAEPRMASFRRL